ncbi:MAG: MBL fold metallo-hydrolase [Desulfobacteraceae bacterium]|nr:MBL fold metallo-hydrolase [Desulfobacteraceae bacterium]
MGKVKKRDLKFSFLGTGASVPKKDRGYPSTLLMYQKSGILIDCGDGVTGQLVMIKDNFIKDVKFIFITHEHFDHYSGIGAFLYSNCVLRRKNPLWIYGNNIVIKNVKKIIEMLEKDITFPMHLISMKEGFLLDYKDMNISAFDTIHSKESYGFIFKIKDENDKTVKKVVYISDTIFFEELINISKRSDLIITECTYLDRDIKLAKKYRHLTISDVERVKKESKSQIVIINHVSRRYKLSEIETGLNEQIIVPFDQFEITV